MKLVFHVLLLTKPDEIHFPFSWWSLILSTTRFISSLSHTFPYASTKCPFSSCLLTTIVLPRLPNIASMYIMVYAIVMLKTCMHTNHIANGCFHKKHTKQHFFSTLGKWKPFGIMILRTRLFSCSNKLSYQSYYFPDFT